MKWRPIIERTFFGILIPLLALALFAGQRPKVWNMSYFQPVVWSLGSLVVVFAVLYLALLIASKLSSKRRKSDTQG